MTDLLCLLKSHLTLIKLKIKVKRLIPAITQHEIKNLFRLNEKPPNESFEMSTFEVGNNPPKTKPMFKILFPYNC